MNRVRTYVARAGPPAVITWKGSNSLIAPMKFTVAMNRLVERISGNVTERKRWIAFAPSMSAAS